MILKALETLISIHLTRLYVAQSITSRIPSVLSVNARLLVYIPKLDTSINSRSMNFELNEALFPQRIHPFFSLDSSRRITRLLLLLLIS